MYPRAECIPCRDRFKKPLQVLHFTKSIGKKNQWWRRNGRLFIEKKRKLLHLHRNVSQLYPVQKMFPSGIGWFKNTVTQLQNWFWFKQTMALISGWMMLSILCPATENTWSSSCLQDIICQLNVGVCCFWTKNFWAEFPNWGIVHLELPATTHLVWRGCLLASMGASPASSNSTETSFPSPFGLWDTWFVAGAARQRVSCVSWESGVVASHRWSERSEIEYWVCLVCF